MGNCLEKKKLKKPNSFQKLEEVSSFKKKISRKNSLHLFKIRMSDFVIKNLSKITDEYKLYNPPLGKGGFGEVRKALHKKTNTMRAIKIIEKTNCDVVGKNMLLREVSILKTMDHPHIVKLYEFFETSRSYYVVMEYLEGQELFNQITEDDFDYSEVNLARLMKQLLSALVYLHAKGIMHRDIKSGNIMVVKNNLILIDFGNSKKVEIDKRNNQLAGTSFYIAPEVIKGAYDERCDIWSAGVLLYVLLTGEPPFKGEGDLLLSNIKTNKVIKPIDEYDNVSTEAKDLIKQMMTPNYKIRPDAKTVLLHPWLNSTKDSTINKKEIRRVANRIENFHFKNKLQEAIYMYFVNILVDKKEAEETIKMFEEMDENGDGVLTKKELADGLAKAGKIYTDEEIDQLFEEVDKDGNGTVSFGEFLAASLDKSKVLSMDRIVSMFKLFDRDKSGKITLDEFQFVFNQNDNLLVDNWQELIKEVDLNGDGEIDFEEFKILMRKLVDKNAKIKN